MEDAIRWTSFVLAALLCAVILKKAEPSYGFLLTLAVSIMVSVAAISGISVLTDYLHENVSLFTGLSDTLFILFRILGITLITCFGAQVCRDCGEGTLAMQLELLGGTLSLVQALPLFTEILSLLCSFDTV